MVNLINMFSLTCDISDTWICSPSPPPGLPSAQKLPGPDAGARPGSAGHGQRASQAPVPVEGGAAVLHRAFDAAEQDEIR